MIEIIAIEYIGSVGGLGRKLCCNKHKLDKAFILNRSRPTIKGCQKPYSMHHSNCNVTFDTRSKSLKYVYTSMPYQAAIVAYNGSNCIARFKVFPFALSWDTLKVLYYLQIHLQRRLFRITQNTRLLHGSKSK